MCRWGVGLGGLSWSRLGQSRGCEGNSAVEH